MVRAVILTGGGGTCLRSLSRTQYPRRAAHYEAPASLYQRGPYHAILMALGLEDDHGLLKLGLLKRSVEQ